MKQIIDIIVTVRDCEHVDRLADLMMDAMTALDVTDTVHIMIGSSDMLRPFDIQAKGWWRVKEVHERAYHAAGQALQAFWNVECGVASAPWSTCRRLISLT